MEMIGKILQAERENQFQPAEVEPQNIVLLQNADFLRITPTAYEGRKAVKVEAKEHIYAQQLIQYLDRRGLPTYAKAIKGTDINHPTGIVLWNEMVYKDSLFTVEVNCEPDCSNNITEVMIKIYHFPSY